MTKKYKGLKSVLDQLHQMANPEKNDFKATKYGIHAENSLGIYMKDLKILAKEIQKNDQLALDLFDTGIYEAQILCSLLFNPKSITPDHIYYWVDKFNTWELCDTFCMSFIGQSPHGYDQIFEFTKRKKEFQKRAGFVLMVGHHFGHKEAPNSDFIEFLPLIKKESIDERNFVKKAVNWALRTIGKRNVDLNQMALSTAEEILTFDSKSARWIARDAIKELSNINTKIQDYPRSIYRSK